MRKIVNLIEPVNRIVRLMIYTDKSGTYLFGYNKLDDSGAEWDKWFETEIDALKSCEMEYGIKITEWLEIPNPEMNCQHDWINPVRIKGRDKGNPEYGKLERLVNNKWIDIE